MAIINQRIVPRAALTLPTKDGPDFLIHFVQDNKNSHLEQAKLVYDDPYFTAKVKAIFAL